MSEPTAPPVPAGPSNETGPIPPYFGPLGRADRTPQPRPAEGALPEDGPPAHGATAVGAEPTTAEAPTVVEPAVAGASAEPVPGQPVPAVPGPAGGPVAAWALTGDAGANGPDAAPPAPPGTFPTTPVTSRPTVRARRRAPLTRMGPWAPAAGALLGLAAGLVAVAFLADRADAFGEGLALVFLVIGLTMLGAAGALLADEVRLVRRGAREAAVRPAWVEATAGLLNGLTPARLLLGAAAFVLFLAAYVGR
ncbi:MULTISPECIES: hypothetical protein [unclassified Blastococcus]